MSRGKSFVKNTAILTFGRICTQCVSFLLLPLYTALLDTSEYGVFDLMITYGTLLLPLVNWQFDQGLFRILLDNRKDREKQTQIFTTVLICAVCQSAGYAAIFLLIQPYLEIEFGWFLLLYVVLHVFSSMLLQFVRGIGKIKKYAAASVLSSSSTIVMNVIALVVLKQGVNGLFASTLLAQGLTIVYLFLSGKTWQYIAISKFSLRIFAEVRRYALPLIPNNLSWWVVNSSDRIIIKHFLGLTANGIFTVASKFSGVFISFYNIVNLSWTESVSLHFEDEDRDEYLSEMVTTIFRLFSSASFIIIAAVPFIFPQLVNEQYLASYNQIIILMYAMLFRVLVGLYSCVYVAQKQSKKIAYTSMATAVINIVIDLLLVRYIGLYAASVSSLVAFASMFLLRYCDIKKTIYMRLERKTVVYTLLTGVLLTVTYYSEHTAMNVIGCVCAVIYSVLINRDIAKIAFQWVQSKVII